MRRTKARLEAFTLEPAGEPGIRLSCAAAVVPEPGQAARAFLPGSGQTLPRLLFPTQRTSTGFTADRPAEPGWRLGDELELLGLVGRGFSPPAGARRWFLASFDRPASRLLPLIEIGLNRGAAVSVWTTHPPPRLPAPVELVPDPREALAWADYLALDVAPESLPRLRDVIRRESNERRAGQVLVAPPMPCGLGVCGACSLKARNGWKCACVDGPVFDLDELEW